MECAHARVLPICISGRLSSTAIGVSDRGKHTTSAMFADDDAQLDSEPDYSYISRVGDGLMLEEGASLASVFSASQSESLELHSMVLRCPWSSLSLAGALSGAHRLLVSDLQTQLFGLRKACSVLTAARPPFRIWISVVRSVCAAVASLFFLSSGFMPLRCARYALGGVYRNTLSACILSEVLDTIISIVQFLSYPNGNVVPDNYIQYTAQKLAVAVGGVIFATAIPTPVLTGHLVLCISHVFVDMCMSSLKKTSAVHLNYLLERMSNWRARVRLSAAVLDSRALIEKTHSDDNGEWTCSELTF